MKGIKHIAALGILVLPIAAFASGSASGTVTHIYHIDSTAYGDVVYVELSGTKTGNPACSDYAPWQFAIPRSSTFYADLFALVMAAQEHAKSITITGTGTCGVDLSVETIASVEG